MRRYFVISIFLSCFIVLPQARAELITEKITKMLQDAREPFEPLFPELSTSPDLELKLIGTVISDKRKVAVLLSKGGKRFFVRENSTVMNLKVHKIDKKKIIMFNSNGDKIELLLK